MTEKDPLTRKEQLQIEGYKALMQYGCQMSQDHVNYDRIIMPVSLLPAYFVLTSSDLQDAGLLAELVIWSAGLVLLLFWHSRNIRSKDRLYKIWDTVSCIETRLGFAAYSEVHGHMKTKKKFSLPDFKIKKIFFVIAVLGYVVVLYYVLWRKCKC